MDKIKARLATVASLPLVAAVSIQLFIGGIANAQTQTGATPSPISNVSGLLQFFCKIVGFFFDFLIALSVLMILWAAYTYVTAGDDTEKTSKARRIITYAAIGVAVALIANGFPALVDSFFGSTSTFSNATC